MIWSKTHQTGTKPFTLLLTYTPDPFLCPMCTYPHMCSHLPAPALAPTFFVAYRSSYYVVITKSQFVLVL